MGELNLLRAASQALRSYQYGNGSPELAESIADKIDAALAATPAADGAVVEALTAYRKAQRAMRDKWADGDSNVKRDLWRNLHDCEAAADAALQSRATPSGGEGS